MLDALNTSQIALLAAGAFVGGAVFGVAGFAFGVIASLFLHHGFRPTDVIFIVVSGALVLNIGLLPRFWRDIDLRRAAPYIVGATIGLPIGLLLLQRLDGRLIRAAVASLVIAYCLFALRQYARAPLRFSAARAPVADGLVGATGGMLGGISGLGPLVPGIWYGLRGFTKVEQRALAQPFGMYVQGLMVLWFVSTSTVSHAAWQGLAVAAPVMLLSAWIGLRLFDRMSTARFQRVVVVLALVGAGFLLARQL